MELKEIKKISVLGSGLMGHGIAQSFLMGGYTVMLYDIDGSILETATNHINSNLELFSQYDLIGKDEIKPALQRLNTTTDLKVAVADVNKVIKNYHKTRAAADLIEDELATMNRERNVRLAKYKLLVDEYNLLAKEANELSPELGQAKKAAAQEKRLEMQSLEREIAQFIERRQRQIETDQATKRRDIFAEIYSAVGAMSKEKGFDLVFDRSGAGLSQMPMLLHANPETIYDLTDEVIAELNKSAPKGYIPGAPAKLPEGGSGVGAPAGPAGGN